MPIKKKSRRSLHDDQKSGGGWEIVYSGFVLILLCFFIMLSSFATIESAKIMRFVKSFIEALSVMPGGQKLESGSTVLPASIDMVDATSDIGKIYKQLEQHAQELGLDQEVELSLTKEGLIMRLSDHAVFDVGEALISHSALPLFNKIGAILRRASYAVRIEGHTDNLPIKTAQYPSNWELSTARAVNVLRHFIETQDIPPQRLSAVGFGEYRPLASNDSPQQRAKNRRVEIIFLHKKAGRLGVSQKN